MQRNAVLLYAALPVGLNLLLALTTYLTPYYIDKHVWLPWVLGISSFGAAIASFVAYFDDEVSNLVAWPSVVVNGAVTILIFALMHSVGGIVYSGPLVGTGNSQHDLTGAIYFSVVTFTTLGYGDFQPSAGMRGLAATEALLGYVYLGFFVGAAVHWVSARNPVAPGPMLTPRELRTLADEREQAAAVPLPTEAASQTVIDPKEPDERES